MRAFREQNKMVRASERVVAVARTDGLLLSDQEAQIARSLASIISIRDAMIERRKREIIGVSRTTDRGMDGWSDLAVSRSAS